MTHLRTKLMLMPFSVLGLAASAPDYSVSRAGTVTGGRYCYTFRVPAYWRLDPGNPVPLLFDLHHSGHAQPGQDLSDNAASVSVIAGPESGEEPHSLDAWMALHDRAHPQSRRRHVDFTPATGINDATEVRWTDAEAGETVTHGVAVFFLFRRTPFAAYLEYKDKGGHAGEFEAGLASVLRSFRPITTGRGCRPT